MVGLGHFAQTVVLPAFAHAEENCDLVAVFSDDEKKRDRLGKKYGAAFALGYDEMDAFLASGEVNAVYLTVPNHKHHEFTLRAAKHGVHVLCEKPMAVTSKQCREMIEACTRNGVRLMIAYRLHFDEANMTAVERIRKGAIGEPRYFVSAFSFPVAEGNVRTLSPAEGGGPLYDIGPYCINAARYLFQAEPTEVVAMSARSDDPRFAKTDEQVSAILRFPGDRLATFTVGFAGADVATYTVVGTKGSLRLEPAYAYAGEMTLEETSPRGTRKRTFPSSDQIAPELIHFARAVLDGRDPAPSGWEGYNDVRIIEALLEAARTGRQVRVDLDDRGERPTLAQTMRKPAAESPEPVNADAPHGG